MSLTYWVQIQFDTSIASESPPLSAPTDLTFMGYDLSNPPSGVILDLYGEPSEIAPYYSPIYAHQFGGVYALTLSGSTFWAAFKKAERLS
jgi:hypothetical protein